MKLSIKVCLQCTALGMAFTMNMYGATWYVSPGGNDANSGQSLGEAKQTIQSAINGAGTGDTVLVNNGLYSLSTQLLLDRAVTVASIKGADATILDGGDVRRCVLITHEAAVLDGFTVQHGKAFNGGGIYCEGGTIRNCVIHDNQSVGNDENDAHGAGVFLYGGTISDSVVHANRATSENSYDYGKVAWAGGIFAQGGTITRCEITGNQVDANYSYGAGVCLIGAELWKSRVIGNTCSGQWAAKGGGVYADIRELSVSSHVEACVIAGNAVNATEVYTYSTTSADGGGLHAGNGTIIRSTLINSNTADSLYGSANGSGAWISGSTLVNCTVVNNTATANNTLGSGPRSHGGGVMWGYTNDCVNNIITANYASDGPNNANVSGYDFPAFDHCFIGQDALFVNGMGADYRLSRGSPCASGGLVQDWMTGSFDPDGQPRLDGGSVSIGAYAYRNPFWNRQTTAYLGTGWQWNGLGFFWDGAFPFLYIWEASGWVYVVGQSEASFYLYDFNHERWSWAGAAFYPWVIVLKSGDPLDGQAVDIRVP